MPPPEEAGPQIRRPSQPEPGIDSSDSAVRRLLSAAGGRALSDGRTEFGLGDLLASVTDDQQAAGELASLGVDVQAVREAIKRDGSPD